MIDCIAGYHLNPWTCGIAKFNTILGRHLSLPVVGIGSPELGRYARPCSPSRCRSSRQTMPGSSTGGWRRTAVDSSCSCTRLTVRPTEERLIAGAARVYVGNRELSDMLVPIRPDVVESFCPGTLLNPQRFQRTDLSVFTFGMAHKIRVPLYRRLHSLLEATGKSYSVYVSTALHENTSFDGSFVVRFEELQAIFGEHVYFMGYLSDTAVFNHIVDCTFLAAFFEKGLRANNTSVIAAMECGSAVITNLDEHSPRGFAHMKNVIDINACDRLPDFEQAERIGRAAREIAQADYGWDQLVAQLRPAVRV